VNLDPTSSEAYSSLGHSLMVNQRWNQAEPALRRSIELDPNNPYAASYLALLLTQKGRNEESVQVSSELAQDNPVAIYFRRVYVMTRHTDMTKLLLKVNALSSWTQTAQPT
jgi:Flp pilus assembly protein TadD